MTRLTGLGAGAVVAMWRLGVGPRGIAARLGVAVRAVRAAVAAEREWAAGVADAEAAVWRSMGASGLTSWDIGSVLVELAAAIRRGPEPTTEGV